MYKIKNLAQKSLKKDLLEEFLNFANNKLDIDQPYSVYFVEDDINASDALGKTAMYNPSTNSVYVYVTNRHPKDILRSIAHELMHHKQNCDGRLDRTYGEGSDNLEKLELEANEAGYLVREFEDNRTKMMEQKTASELAREEYTQGNIAQVPGNPLFFHRQKCGANEEKRKIAGITGERRMACVPKNFAVAKKDTAIMDLTPADLTLQDLEIAGKEIEGKGNRSIFATKLTPISITNAIVAHATIMDDIKRIKAVPDVDEGFVQRRAKFIQDLKKGQVGMNEQKKESAKISYHRKPTRDAATRLYYLLRDDILLIPGDQTRATDLVGKVFGPDLFKFGRALKVEPKFLNYYKQAAEPIKQRASDIFSVNAPGAGVGTFGGRERQKRENLLLSLQDTLDIVGMSPDPYGVGAAADLANGLIYLGRFISEDKGEFGFTDMPIIGVDEKIIPTNDNFWNAAISFAGLTIFGDTLKVQRGPLKRLFNFIEKYVQKGKVFVDRRTAIAYLSTIQVVVDWFTNFLRKLRDNIMVAGKTSDNIAPEELKKTGLYKLFGSSWDNVEKIIQGRITSLKEASDVLSEYVTNLRRFKIMVQEAITVDFADDIIKSYFKSPEQTAPLFKQVFQDVVESQMKTADAVLKSGTVDEAAESATRLFLKDQENFLNLQNKFIETFTSPQFKEIFSERFDDFLDTLSDYKVIDIKQAAKDPEAFKKSLTPLIQRFAKKEIDTAMKSIAKGTIDELPEGQKALAKILKGSFSQTLDKIMPKYLKGGLVAAKAGRAFRGLAQKDLVKFLTNFIRKNVLVVEGFGGVIYTKSARAVLDELKKVVKKFKTLNLKQIVSIIMNVLPLYFKIVYFLLVGKFSVYLNLYARYYRPVCGAKSFSEYTENVMLPVMGKFVQLLTFNLFNTDLSEKKGEEVNKIARAVAEAADIATSFAFNPDGSFTISGKTVACKRYKEVADLATTGEAAKQFKPLKNVFDEIQEDLLIYEVEQRQKARSRIADDSLDIRPPKTPKDTGDNSAAATQAKKDADQGIKDAGKGAREVKKKIDKAIIDGRKAASEEEMDLEESKSISDYRKKLLNERLEKLTIGLTK
jgi:hypothetical protein